MRDARVQVGQIALQVRDYQGDGDAIVFLHFSGANMMMWQRVIPAFRAQYRVLLVDLRGHGRSDKPEAGYHIDQMAMDVVGVLQSLGLARAHVVGSSLGAEVGLSMAANHPETVTSLVCDGALFSEYGPYGIWAGTEAEYAEHVASELDRIRNTPEAIYPSVDALAADRRRVLESRGWWNEHVEAMVRYDACDLGDGRYVRSFSRKAAADYMKHYYQCRFEEYYARVECPLLMLGEAELVDEREKAARGGLAQLPAHGKLVLLDGWVHPYGWLLTPETASRAILRFWAGNPD